LGFVAAIKPDVPVADQQLLMLNKEEETDGISTIVRACNNRIHESKAEVANVTYHCMVQVNKHTAALHAYCHLLMYLPVAIEPAKLVQV
jgi:hypothetical protein